MKYVKLNEKAIAYSSEGRGEAVVFVHGFCEDSSVWDEFKLDLLDRKVRVVCVDLPGFGESEVVDNLTIDGMADAVKAVVDHLNLEKIVLIGHSMGGYTGLAFARKFPELLKGLGIFHSHPFADSEDKKENRYKGIDFIKRQGHELFVKQLIPKLFAPGFEGSNRFLVDKLIHLASKYKPEGIINGQVAMAERPDQAEVLKNIKVPVLFIIGEKDNAVTMEQSMEQTSLPDVASVHILEKVGHMGMFEAKKQTQRMVRHFVDLCYKD
jgi:pimeloyl-ACP methyl ester carboxylesterase